MALHGSLRGVPRPSHHPHRTRPRYCHTITNPQIAASVAFFLLKGPFLLYKLYPPVVATPKIFHDIDSLEKLRLHTTSLGVIINGTLEFKIQVNLQKSQNNAFFGIAIT